MRLWREAASILAQQGLAALITLRDVKGSSPREAGARLLLRPDGGFHGSIGGGVLEHESLREALALLVAGQAVGIERRHLLGPDLGQCCGGQVTVAIEVFTRADGEWIDRLAAAESSDGTLTTVGHLDAAGRQVRRPAGPLEEGQRECFGTRRTPVLLFGAGHVGRAVVLALAPLPFDIGWVDPRADAFPAHAPPNARLLQVDDPAGLAAQAAPGSLALVMTHSHPLDLAIVAAALASGACPFVGLIGSATKRARFVSQLRQSGLGDAQIAPLSCPIGGGLVRDKSPSVIAAVVAIALLQARERIG